VGGTYSTHGGKEKNMNYSDTRISRKKAKEEFEDNIKINLS
jgi:hypothetical protein